jgi:RES domain
LTTWTPPALASNARRYTRELWRVVEAQHTASTMRLVDSLAEQTVLEQLLEASKPAIPASAASLHYLLATPFRYRPAQGSRFRAPQAAGVWYGAEHLRTALAEKSYWRQRFLLDSPGTPDLGPVPHTAFRAAVQSARAIDLTKPPLSRDEKYWTHKTDYSATQKLAAAARGVEPPLQLIRYRSVRDPRPGHCAAILDPAAFKSSNPLHQETWFIAAGRERVRCLHDLPGVDRSAFEFQF